MRLSGSVSWRVAWRGAQNLGIYGSPEGRKIGSYGTAIHIISASLYAEARRGGFGNLCPESNV